jgi:tryptophanase
MDYVIEVVERVAAKAGDLVGMEITYQPERLRHFTAHFRPLPQR